MDGLEPDDLHLDEQQQSVADSWQQAQDDQVLQRIEGILLEALLDLREGRLPSIRQVGIRVLQTG